MLKYMLVGLVSICSLARAIDLPKPNGYVSDYANVLTTSQRNEISNVIAANIKNGGWQIAVVTVPNLQGVTIEEFANALFQSWGIGRKGIDDGVLLIQSVNPRKIRIEVGAGVEGDLTDLHSSRIIREVIATKLRAGDNYLGLMDGVKAIIKARPIPLTAEELAAKKVAEEKLAAESALFWHTFWSYALIAMLVLSPFIVFATIVIRKKNRAKRMIEEAREKRERERERVELAAERERERVAKAEDLAWRKENPEKAKERDKREADEQKRLAAAAVIAAALERKRRREEESSSSYSGGSSYSSGSSSDSDSSSSFGGFGGGSSNGGGASGDY